MENKSLFMQALGMMARDMVSKKSAPSSGLGILRGFKGYPGNARARGKAKRRKAGKR